MKEVLYESEIFADDAVGGVLPFKIIVESSFEDGKKTVTVTRKDYKPLTPTRVFESDQVLTSSMWYVRNQDQA